MNRIYLLLFLSASLVSAEVREISDPASYSAGTMGKEEINRWFQKNIQEENYNLWIGKKDRMYLHGAWKFRLLENTEKNSGKIHPGNRGLSSEGIETTYGEKAGFYKENFDDSAWFFQPVPYAWIDRFLKPGNVKGGEPYAEQFRIHEGWYRRVFSLPDSWKNGRVLLHFRGIAYKADVYLNGKRIGSYENSRPNHLWVGSARTEERFCFDITENLKGKSNLLAVKVFSPFRNGGIWQEVYLEREPEIYAEKILITPNTENGEVTLRTFFVNTTGKSARSPLQAELCGWKSFRYERSWPLRKYPLTGEEIPPGRSEQTFRIRVKDPRLWSPENPNLYHLILRDSKGQILGQERFGFRTFRLGKNSFLLNGKKIYLRGENLDCFGWSFCGFRLMNSGFGVLNSKRKMETMMKNYLGCGYNIFRANGNLPLELVFDIGDEIGLLFTADDNPDITRIRLKNGKALLSDSQKECIRKRCFTIYNHPSVVTGTARNEAFEKQLIGTKFESCGWAPILNAIYEEYKKWDPSRPFASSSGRGWKGGDRIYMPAINTAKADYDVCHPYGTNRKLKSAETDSYAASYYRFKKNYAQEHGGAERVMFVGESSEFYTFSPTSGGGKRIFNNRVRDFAPHIRNGEFDRKWLAENLKVLRPDYLSEACEYSLIPLVDSVNVAESLRIQGWHNRQVMEQFRRLRPIVAGYILHLPGIFKDFSFGDFYRQTYDAAKMAQQKILACFSGFAPRNLVVGRNFSSELYLINDSERVLKNPEVRIARLKDSSLQKKVRFPSLNPGEMRKVSLVFPVSGTAEGEDRIILSVFSEEKKVGENEFEIYVGNPSAWRLKKGRRSPLCILGNHPGLMKFLNSLNLSCQVVKTVPGDLDSVLILLPGCGKENMKAAVKWVRRGGKAVALEQNELCDEMRLRCSSSGFRDWTELVLKSHPIFSGLRQDQFRYWNGKEGDPESMNLFNQAVLPLKDGVLAMSLTRNYRMGMTVAEYRMGKGRWLISQLRVLERFSHDSAAARYLFNLLDYVSGGFDDKRAPLFSGKMQKTSYSVNPSQIVPVDLKPYVNMGFRDEVAHDKKGGWSDHGPDHDARIFPVGKRLFAGVPFEVIDPAGNKGKSCIVLRGGKGTETEFLPDRVERIRIGMPVQKLYFLMTSKYTPKSAFGELKIHMNIGRGGGTVAEHSIPLVGFRNLGDWWNVKEVPEAFIGWRGVPSDTGVEVGVYVLEWTNPERSVEVESIDFRSNSTGIPILIGISAMR